MGRSRFGAALTAALMTAALGCGTAHPPTTAAGRMRTPPVGDAPPAPPQPTTDGKQDEAPEKKKDAAPKTKDTPFYPG